MTGGTIAAACGFLLIVLLAIFWRLPNAEKAGRQGEKRVAKKLSDLDSSVYKAFHNVLLTTARGSAQIDHVVICAYGIFVIETKNFKGRLTGGLESETWQQHFGAKSYPLRNPVLQNEGHVRALMRALKLTDRTLFVPLVVFAGSADVEVPVVALGYLAAKFLASLSDSSATKTSPAPGTSLRPNISTGVEGPASLTRRPLSSIIALTLP